MPTCEALLYLEFRGHVVEDVVEELEGSVERDLNPTRGLLDALAAVIRTPALHKAQAEYAQPPEVVNTYSCRRE